MPYPRHCERLIADEITGAPTLCGALRNPGWIFCNDCMAEIERDQQCSHGVPDTVEQLGARPIAERG